MTDRPTFSPCIEVHPDRIIIRTADAAALGRIIRDAIYGGAEALSDERSPWDGESSSGDQVFEQVVRTVADVLRGVADSIGAAIGPSGE